MRTKVYLETIVIFHISYFEIQSEHKEKQYLLVMLEIIKRKRKPEKNQNRFKYNILFLYNTLIFLKLSNIIIK